MHLQWLWNYLSNRKQYIQIDDWHKTNYETAKIGVPQRSILGPVFLERRRQGSIRLVLLVTIAWLVGWLVGNAVFSEMALRIFLIFCMKSGDYKGSKLTELDFWKKFLIWRYLRKGLQIHPKSDTLIFFLKNGFNDFFWFLAWS